MQQSSTRGAPRAHRPPTPAPYLMALLACAAATASSIALAGPQAGLPVEHLEAWLRSIPAWAFVLAFVLLPAFGFPISLFYLTVGAVFPTPALSLAVAWGCMSLNTALAYWVARVLAHPVERLLRRRGYPLPHLPDSAQWRAIVLLRASPLPVLMQSWLLALGGARFLPYMVFGLPVEVLVAAGLVLLGESLFQANLGWVGVGVAVVVLGQMVLVGLRRRLRGDTSVI